MFKKKEVELSIFEKNKQRITKKQDLDFFNLGFNAKRQVWNLVSPQSLLFVGEIGSGKSLSLVNVVTSFFLQHQDNSLLFLMDWNKGINDYQMLFEENNVYRILDGEGILKVIDLAYEEMLARINSNQKQEFANMLIVMEDLKMMSEALFMYEPEHAIEGSYAWKLKKLIKEGSLCKIYILGTMYEAPNMDLLETFPIKVIFKTSYQTSFKIIGSDEAHKISRNNKMEISAFLNSEITLFDYLSIFDWKEIVDEN